MNIDLMHDDSEMQRYMGNMDSDVPTEDERVIEGTGKAPLAGPSTSKSLAI